MDDNNLPDELWTSAEAASYLGMRLKRLISLAGQGRSLAAIRSVPVCTRLALRCR